MQSEDPALRGLYRKRAGITNAILDIEGLTRIIITHKLEENILRRFDEIVVVKNGTIVERGSFQKLIESRQYFYSLYNVEVLSA